MPRDIAADTQSLIQIRDATGGQLPFSRGIMATSILATGLDTARAYAIAEEIQQSLSSNGPRVLVAAELAERAATIIETSAGGDVARRYRAWRKAKRTGRPIVVSLSGAPGVGKSTVATRLALRFGINRVVPTDAIREVLRTVVPSTVLPELHVSTYERVDQDHDEDPAFLRQARAVSAATAAVATRLVAEQRSVILEGVHLLPGDVTARLIGASEDSAEPIVVERLLTLGDEEVHLAHLTRRMTAEPGRAGSRHLEHFAAIRQQQETLRRFAASAGVAEHDIAHPEDLTQRIVDDVVALAEDAAPPEGAPPAEATAVAGAPPIATSGATP